MQKQDSIPIFNFRKAENTNTSKTLYSDNDYLYSIYDVKKSVNKEKYDKIFSTFEELQNKFKNHFQTDFNFIARAPGRVNIIGEHIDYAGFSVLPMAIENDILIACNTEINKNTHNQNKILIEINHLNIDLFKKYTLEIQKENYDLEFIKPHSWVNYLIAGFNSIVKGFNIDLNSLRSFEFNKINFLVTGNIPYSSGLSSSSALTVAGALATLKLFNLESQFSKFDIANATINYERSVGTACGGMDQTISICGEKGKAKLIEFIPTLNAKSVTLPNNSSFIIANSLTESTKIDTLAFRYNKRVVENKLGLAFIAKSLKLEYTPEILIELKNNYPTTGNVIDFAKLHELILNNLKSDDYTLNEIKAELGEENLKNLLVKVPYYEEVLQKNNSFSLKNRLIHVCLESERVEKFYSICNRDDLNSLNDKVMELGKLMNKSHISCRDLYECSSKQLDLLVDFSVANGAIGARLTGAGWGGCCVIMVKNEDLDGLLMKLTGYYEQNFNLDFNQSYLDKNDYFFYTKASQGACIIMNN
jgi:N-acetylgalactosamine kinase